MFYSHLSLFVFVFLVPSGTILIIKIFTFCSFKARTIKFIKQMIAIRKLLLIVTILIQISIATYFNYYSFFLINSEVVVFILLPFSLPILFIIFILIKRFTFFQKNRRQNLQSPSTTDETLLGCGTTNIGYKYSVTSNYKWNKIITIICFLVLQDLEIPLLLFVNFPSPNDDYAIAVAYVLFVFTRLSLFLILILFGILFIKF